MRATFPASTACAAALLAGCGAAAVEDPGGGRWSRLDAPASTHRAVVWAVGDGADGGAAARRVARRIARGRPDWLLYLGDVYDGNGLRQYRRHYGRVYGRFTKITAPTPGNHEWPRHRSGYDRYWTGVRGTRPPAYYAVSLAGWRIVSLNSEVAHGNRSRQLRWLRRLLRRNPTNCTIAIWHRPLRSAGIHGDQRDVTPFWSALRGHAVLVLNGHDHDLQRHRPRDGIVELVAGAGGHDRYPIDPSYPGLAFGDARHYGALRLVLRRGRASFTFVSSGGRRLDAGRVHCR
ncbi:MAG TPA: metallophosphoesterase family protein [Vicinamibacteria bacterium]|nr:metallophosphoesterase family protein [Vicinamibacteria bacterium]